MSKIMCGEVFDATKHPNMRSYYNKTCMTPFTFFIFEENRPDAFWLPTDLSMRCGFDSIRDAEMIRAAFSGCSLHDMYIVMRNSDMCSGAGPMILDSVFRSMSLAHDYIKGQEGVQGRSQKAQLYFGVNINGYLYGWNKFPDFNIIPTNFRR